MPRIYTEDILDAPPNELVYWCSAVDQRTILEAIRAGAVSLEDIRRMTGACTLRRCKELSPRGRCCAKEINRLLEAAHQAKE